MSALPDLREIRVFLAVADELHFARAAERLVLTPSRVSQIVRSFERRVGGPLFERTSRRVALTPLGEELHRELAVHYRAMERAIGAAQEAAGGGVGGVVRIGTYSPANGGPRLTEIIRTFEARHPAAGIVVIDTFGGHQWSWLRRGEVDLMISRLPVSEPGLSVGGVLVREDRALAVARDHPLASQPMVAYEDLADYVVSDSPTLPREQMDAFIPPRTASGRTLRRAQVGSMMEVVMRVASGELVHPTVRSFAEHHTHPGLVTVPIVDLPPSETVLVWRSDDQRPVVAAFLRVADAVLGDP